MNSIVRVFDNFIRIYGLDLENHKKFINFLKSGGYTYEEDYLSRELLDQSLLKKEIDSISDLAKDFSIELKIEDETKKIIKIFDSSKETYSKARDTDKNEIKDVEIDQKEFVRKLKSYQIPSVNHLVEIPHSANFSIPGSGKTSIVLAAYSVLKKREGYEKVVVICPLGAFRAWEEEWEACFGEKVDSYRIGSESKYSIRIRFGSSELILIGYKMAKNLVEKLKEQLDKYKIFLVVDESHRIKKFPDEKWDTSNASGILELAPHAEKRLILTGTPMPHSLRDLWSQFTFLYCNREIFGTSTEFDSRIPMKYENSIEEKLLKEFSDKIENLYVRITKNELNLPEANNKIHYVDMKPIQKKIWKAIKDAEFPSGESIRSQAYVLNEYRIPISVRLLQISSNPGILSVSGEIYGDEEVPVLEHPDVDMQQLIENYAKFNEIPEKFEKTLELVKQILNEDGEKVIVWSNYIHNIEILRKKLNEFNPIVIHSKIDQFEEDEEWNKQNEERIEEFKKNPEKRVLITTTQSCGEAISLHKVCTNAIYFDRNFNAGLYMQSKDRIHRIGTDKEVTYHILITKDSLDEDLNDVLEEREENMKILLNEKKLKLKLSGEGISNDSEDNIGELVLEKWKNRLSEY